MPRLLLINVCANWGSTGKIAEQIGVCAEKNGWNCFFAYGRSSNPSKLNLIKIGNKWDVYRHYAEYRFFDNEGLVSVKATKQFLKDVDELKTDIVHLHNIHDHYINFPLLFSYLREKKLPVIWTQHDQWAITGHCGVNLVGCNKWKTGCDNCPQLFRWQRDRSNRNYVIKKQLFTGMENMTLVPVSEWLGSIFRQSFLYEKKIHVIHNGVDTSIFYPRKTDIKKRYGVNDKKIILGVATTWSPGKNLDHYCRLSKLLTDDWRIILVGLTQRQIKGLPSGVIGIQRTNSQEELAQFYSASNVVMSLSESETFGLTIAEGLACGTPGIVYNNTAQPELISENTGAVVANGDFKALIGAINRFSNKTEASVEECRNRALELFDAATGYNEYIKLYEQVLLKE